MDFCLIGEGRGQRWAGRTSVSGKVIGPVCQALCDSFNYRFFHLEVDLDLDYSIGASLWNIVIPHREIGGGL